MFAGFPDKHNDFLEEDDEHWRPEFTDPPKLNEDGTNWVQWKTEMGWFLTANGLRSHFEDERIPPQLPSLPADPDDAQIHSYERAKRRLDGYYRRENLLLLYLHLVVDPTLKTKVRAAKTGAAAWRVICEEYEQNRQCEQVIVVLRRKLFTLACEEGGDVRAHIDAMMDLQVQLAAMGGEVDDRTLMFSILGSLPDSVDDVVSELTHEHDLRQRKKEKAGLKTIPETENTPSKEPKKPKNKRKRKPRKSQQQEKLKT